MKPKVLIVDDDSSLRFMLFNAVSQFGYEAVMSNSPEEAMRMIRFDRFDILLTDLQMPGMDGIELLKITKKHNPTVTVVMLTAHGTIETAIKAIKLGAEDFLTKPVDMAVLEALLAKVTKNRETVKECAKLKSEVQILRRELKVKYKIISSIGRSDAATKLNANIQKHIKLRNPLLISGERGTKKGDIVGLIHYNSPWAETNLIRFDCASVPSEYQDVQLFGFVNPGSRGEKMAGTPGMVEKAHLGTLAISNIDKLSPACQDRLFEAITEEKSTRVNGANYFLSSFRLIATTNAPQLPVESSLFKALNSNKLLVPALRDRKEDIGILIAAYAKTCGESLGIQVKHIDEDIQKALKDYDFPGNIRELEAMIESAVARMESDSLKLKDLANIIVKKSA